MKNIFAAAAMTMLAIQPAIAQSIIVDEDHALRCDTFPQSEFAAAWKGSQLHRRVVTGNPDRYKAYDNFVTNFWLNLEQQKPDLNSLSWENLQILRNGPTVGTIFDRIQNAYLAAWAQADDMRSYNAHVALVISIGKDAPTYRLSNFDFPADAGDIYGEALKMTISGLPAGANLDSGEQNEDGTWDFAWDHIPAEIILSVPSLIPGNGGVKVTATIKGLDNQLFTTPMTVQRDLLEAEQDNPALMTNFPDAVFYPEDLQGASLKGQVTLQNIVGFGAQNGMDINLRIHRGENPDPKNFYYIPLAENLGIFSQLSMSDPAQDLLGAPVAPRASFSPFYHGVSLGGLICNP